MSFDAHTRLTADRGGAPFPPLATIPVIVTSSGNDANLKVNTNAAVHFASGDRDRHLHSSPTFASASPDVEDAEMLFEQELADAGMSEFIALDALRGSSPFMTDNSPVPAAAFISNNASSPSHASPPPPSDADGASPALSDSNSNFGFGSPSTESWSASNLHLVDVNNPSPRSPPLYSPTYDFPALTHGPGLAFGDGNSDGAHGALFASPYGYGYDYNMAGPDASMPFDGNPCADSAGYGLGLTPHAETMLPWEAFNILTSQPQSHTQPQTQQLPRADIEAYSPTTPHQQGAVQMQEQGQSQPEQVQQDQQQTFPFPPGAMEIPTRPRLAPNSSPSISPRDLELHSQVSATVPRNTPEWAKVLYDSMGSSTSPGMFGDHGRSASETSVFGRKTRGQAFDFASPQPISSAMPIPIPSGANGSGSMAADFYSFPQMFQPASAPAQPHSGFAFMPSTEQSTLPGGALDGPFNQDTGASPHSTDFGNGNKAGSGNGSSLRARMRSVSQRLGSGLRDTHRAFSTRVTGFGQGPVQRQRLEGSEHGERRPKAEGKKAWSESLGMPSALEMTIDKDANYSVNLPPNEDNMATVRVAFPRLHSSTSSSSLGVGLSEGNPDATVRPKKRSSKAQTPSPSLRPYPLSPGREKSRERSLDPPSPSKSSKEDTPERSELRPPKLAPSTWQLYFTDWIQMHQTNSGDRKLNVAQAAKEAGAEYAQLTPEEKEVC